MDALGSSNAGPGRLDVGLVDEVYSRWVMETKSVEGALEGLEAVASDAGRPALERSKARLSQAHLHWQYGDRESALESVDLGLELSETVDGTLLKARLLDAGGDESGATEWYRKALDGTELAAEREFIRIRLSMIGVDRRNVEGLVDLARDRDQEFKNRAAITLAVLGHPERALELYRPDPESPRHFRQLVRVAEWALKAEDYERARDHAWRAYDATELRFDGLYALTLVDEAYRGEGRMDDLVRELESRGTANEDLLDLRIDLLIDLERYDDAIDLFHAINRDTSDVEARMRLIQIYDTAGKSSEMVSEYENLIEREPTVVQWYVGLASYYINVAEPERALEVWERFEESNRDLVEVLVLGGEFMNQMGYVSEAVAMVEGHAASHGPSVHGNVFLFETHFARGREAEAEGAVEELWASLPPDSGDLRVVADSFERLRKYERALDVYEAIREHEGKLGYDDRMRLAWLHNVVGNQERALELWREIWVAEEAPARRSFAESQLLQIAAELNALADIAVELEGKLYSGEADRNEMNLLVRIYTEVGDSFSATEIVKEFARSTDMPEVEKLRQLGLVYLQLQEYSKYDEVLRRLEQIDPEHRLEHIQNIVLNLLAYDLAEGTNERYEDIKHWLEELRRYDAEAVSGEFEASVLSMGGFSEEAIESYRRALIEQPEHSDNLLLMADLMKEDDRTMEAVALLQYVAEHASDDNEFVVAVDGIINMVGQRLFGQQLSAEVEAVFRWTHRVILERITGREDKFYLYTLLAEIAQETNDREGEFAAMENSVSEAGIRRLAVLREIVTMATPNAGFFSIYRNEGDPDRQLTYGRRLIGLRQQLPPEVYISVARTLLTRGDTVGAERSLSLVRDITGQIDVVKTKADLFLAAGYSKQALASYSQALTVNRDSLELQFKTAALREGNGQLDVANALYASALDKVMRGLPAALHAAPPSGRAGSSMAMAVSGGVAISMSSSRGVNTGVSRDFRTYYEMLMQGLIATWPSSEEEQKKVLDEFLGMFNEEFDKAIAIVEEESVEATEEAESEDEEAETISLARFSRLSHLSQMLRRLCFAIDQGDISEQLDQRLLEHFGEDEDYIATLRYHYTKVGFEISPVLAEAVKVEESKNYPEDATRVERELLIAIDGPQLEKLVRLGRIAEFPQPVERLFRDFLREENYNVLRYASVALEDADYTRLLNMAIPMLQEEPADLMRFLLNDPIFLLEIEERIGDRVVTLDSAFLKNSEVQQAVQRFGFLGTAGLWFYVNKRGNPDEMVMVFEQIVKGVRANQFSLALDMFSIHAHLLQTSLNEELQARFMEATKELLQKVDLQDEFMRRYAMYMIYNFNVAPENVELFLDIVNHYYAVAPENDNASPILKSFYEGSVDEAFDALVEIYRENPDVGFYTNDSLYTVFSSQYLQALQEIRDGTMDDLELAKWFLQSSTRTFEDHDVLPDVEERLNLITGLFERFPEDKELALLILGGKLGSQQMNGLLGHLQDYYEIDSSEESIRMAYYLTALKDEMYDQALAIALDGGPDLRHPLIREGILDRNDSAEPYDYFDPAAILSIVRGNDPFNRMMRSGFMPEGLESMVARVQDQVAEEPLDEEQAKNLVRSLWRGVQAASIGDAASGFYGTRNFLPTLLLWPSQGSPSIDTMYLSLGVSYFAMGSEEESLEEGQKPTLFETLVSSAPLGEELELLMNSLSQSEQLRFDALHDLVSTAYREYPEQLSKRIGELSSKVVEGTASDLDFMFWMRLVLDSEASLTKEESEAFVSRAQGMKSPIDQQLSKFATLLSKQGHFDHAVDCYELLAVRKARLNEFAPSGRIVIPGSSGNGQSSSILHLIEEASNHLPKEKLQTFVHRVVSLVQPFRDTPEFRSVWEAFAIKAFAIAYELPEVLENLNKHIPNVDRSGDVVQGFDGVRLVELVRLHHLLGNSREADRLSRTFFTTESASKSTQLTEVESVSPRMLGLGSTYQSLSNVQSLSGLLGLRIPGMGSSMVSINAPSVPTSGELFVFSLSETLNFDDSASVDSTADAFLDWLDDDDIEKSSVIKGLTKITNVLVSRKELDRAQRIGDRIQNWLLSQPVEQIDSELVRSIALMGSKTQLLIDPEIAQIVFDDGLLDAEQELEFVKLLQEQLESPTLVSSIRHIDLETAGLSLLQGLRPIVEQANDVEFLKELDARILTLENSYESIEVVGGLDLETVESS